MERLTSEMERIQWRKDKVQKLSTKGHSYTEIASILQVAVIGIVVVIMAIISI